MDKVEEIKKRIEAGQKILDELFDMTDEQIREKLQEIPGLGRDAGGLDGIHNQALLQQPITRTIHDGRPKKLELHFYDALKIDCLGIHYIPEHGGTTTIITFSKHFKL